MILMISTWSLRKILKKSLRRILRKNLKRTLKKSRRRLQRWRGSYERELVVENIKLRELKTDEISNTLLRMGQERTERELYRLRAWTYDFYEEMVQAGVVGVRPNEAIDVNCQPHSSNGTESVVRLTRWFEKMEQVFEISKCAKEDKTNVRTMMTTEYCPATEIQKIKQELWTLTVKGDDIEEYYNRLHELALMCPNMVTPKKNKIERYIRGLPKKVKVNVTSSKPASLHDAINMDRENKRREAAKAYVAAPAGGKVYLGNIPLCNRFVNPTGYFSIQPRVGFSPRTSERRLEANVAELMIHLFSRPSYTKSKKFAICCRL
uniref:Retrotransposon gag domain-containing protein n=1 Tax=Tanacetum cinerariifolium TaxID=118510 RepID=A0A6L2NNX0_TANCI|nr:hypothetical protein [Tanacetum cinerariifolium]